MSVINFPSSSANPVCALIIAQMCTRPRLFPKEVWLMCVKNQYTVCVCTRSLLNGEFNPLGNKSLYWHCTLCYPKANKFSNAHATHHQWCSVQEIYSWHQYIWWDWHYKIYIDAKFIYLQTTTKMKNWNETRFLFKIIKSIHYFGLYYVSQNIFFWKRIIEFWESISIRGSDQVFYKQPKHAGIFKTHVFFQFYDIFLQI